MKLTALFCMAFILTFQAMAYDFSQADALFKAREDNPKAIFGARAGYQQALKEAQGSEKIYAAEQLGKLAYYEGHLLMAENDHASRIQVFSQCMQDMDAIRPDEVGESGAYYYYKSMCLALWGKSASKFSVVPRISELKSLLARGSELFSDYYSGGMHRVRASVYIKSKLLSVFGLYDPQTALSEAEVAIQKGPEFYNAYFLKAEAMAALGQREPAIRLLNDKIREIQEKISKHQLPLGLEAETKGMLKEAIRLRDSL